MKISLSLSNDPSPASLLITDCPVDEYSGLYVFAGQANGRGHWQTSTDVTMHLYWGPQGTWLLRGNFEPTVRACPRRSSILRVYHIKPAVYGGFAWVRRPLSRPFLRESARAVQYLLRFCRDRRPVAHRLPPLDVAHRRELDGETDHDRERVTAGGCAVPVHPRLFHSGLSIAHARCVQGRAGGG